tara:strand:+ start:6184 stop:8439 length:2256 start_codon:yes stop_codon:yes gene_type:complete
MQNKVQLYIKNDSGNYDRVDLYSNETIELTSKIQDLRDIGKIFTDFSQSFNVPASDTNNKIFRHFYNFNITGGAFDSRKKREAIIEINHLRFREGKININNVKLKNNKPNSYNIIFYGKTVSIKDLIGDDEISDLTYLENYNHEYTNTNVKDGFQNGLDFTVDGVSQSDAIIYPLITSKKRLFYNSETYTNSTTPNAFNGNLYYSGDTSSSPRNDNFGRGLKFTDLKPAIKAIHIIEAIENQYPAITFTRDFFGSSTFSNLYFWVNSKKGEFNDRDDDEGYLFTKKLSGFTSSSPDFRINNGASPITGTTLSLNTAGAGFFKFTLSFDVSDANVKYNIITRDVINKEETVVSKVGNTSNEVILFLSTVGTTTFTNVNIEIEIKSETALTISNISLATESSPLSGTNINSTYTISTSPQTSFELLMDQRFPSMKVIDFITGIFKLFNLTAYYIEDPTDSDYDKIYVDTLDNFYSDAVNNQLTQTITLDKYVDIKQHEVESTLPFTDIDFKFEKTDTVLMKNHENQFGEIFGNGEFNVRRNFPDIIDRGTKYEIKAPFSHFKYERMLDTGAAGTITDIQWGYCAGGEFNSDSDVDPPTADYDTLLVKPLLFYGVRETSISTGIAWVNNSTSVESITNYYRPSNGSDEGDAQTAPTVQLNFDNEFDEWNRINYHISSNSLYNKFYKSYVEGVFNAARRMFKITAFLPPNILVNYRLNHQIKIQDKMFRINSITTNLITGKSEIELYNIFAKDIV